MEGRSRGNSGPRVRLLGFVADADLPAYLQEDGQDAPAQDGSPDGTPPAKPAGS